MMHSLNEWHERLKDQLLPVVRDHREAALAVIADEKRPLSDLESVASQDAALSLLMLTAVNQRRKPASQGVATVGAAVGLMGRSAVESLIGAAPVLEDVVADDEQRSDYKRLLMRSYHGACQAGHWAALNRDRSPGEVHFSALIRFVGELMTCAYAYEQYRRVRAQSLRPGVCDGAAARGEFGFSLDALGHALGVQWRFPDVMLAALSPLDVSNYRSATVLLGCEVARLAERGWYTPAMEFAIEAASALVHRSGDRVTADMHQMAAEVARALFFDDVRSPVSLLLLPVDETPYPPDGVEAQNRGMAPELERPVTRPLVDRTPVSSRDAVASDGPEVAVMRRLGEARSASSVLTTLVEGLARDCGLRRVVLALYAQDRKVLAVRAAQGVEADSALSRLRFTPGSGGLLGRLLQGPAAVRVTADDYAKCSRGLPEALLSATRSREFFLMSITVGETPIGVVYADAEGGALTDEMYSAFKRVCMAGSRALRRVQRARVGGNRGQGRVN
jgi:HD-like signal output (HDOD) protein